MAATSEGRRLTEQHRLAQARLGADTVNRLMNLWVILNAETGRLKVDEWVGAVEMVIDRQYGVSAAMAREYYTTFRVAELAEASRLLEFPTPVLPAATVRASMIATGPARIASALAGGMDLPAATLRAQVASAREAMRLSLAGGRRQLLGAVEADTAALGWARVSSGAPCAFCAMLLSRGPVYKTQRTASFQSHPSCGCTAEPFFKSDQPWPPGARSAKAFWNSVTPGHSDQLNAFRRAWEGRSGVEK